VFQALDIDSEKFRDLVRYTCRLEISSKTTNKILASHNKTSMKTSAHQLLSISNKDQYIGKIIDCINFFYHGTNLGLSDLQHRKHQL
jgi:hypothetical protein